MVARPFRLPVSDLVRRRDRASRRPVQRVGPLGGIRATSSYLPEDEAVAVDVVLEPLEGAVVVRGQVEAPWRGQCVRCLEPVQGRLLTSVREVFEVDHVEGETYPLEADHLDLEPLARDAIALELPQLPLCRDDCQGLCPVCGVNRNEGTCVCPPPGTDPRWAALDQLRTPEDTSPT